MFKIIFALILLTFSRGADAQSSAAYAGLVYPQFNQGIAAGVCSPLCTSVTAEWIVATVTYSGSGSTENYLQWIGVMGNFTTNSDANNCPGYQCLGQFGTRGQVTSAGVQSYEAWFELFCPNAPTPPCNNLQGPVGGMVISAGDHMKGLLSCITNCSPAYNVSAEWSVILLDVTTGVTCNMTPARGCGTACTTGAENGCMNWPVGQAEVPIVGETTVDRTPLFSATPFTNITINGTTPIFPVASLNHAYVFQNTATGGARTSFPSQLQNGNGASFNLCRAAGSYSAASDFCPVGSYKGNAGLGVQ